MRSGKEATKPFYEQVVDRIYTLKKNPRISDDAILVVELNAMGAPVFDWLRQVGLGPIGINVTAAKEVTLSTMGYNVPKRDLVMNMQVLFQTSRLHIAPDIMQGSVNLSKLFREQLKHFTAEMRKSGYVAFGADVESIHDDIVTSSAEALWYAENVLDHEMSFTKAEEKEFNPAKHGLTEDG
jgi:hypothetical protein